MKEAILSAVIHREGDLYVAQCPEIGTASQGKTVEEAKENQFLQKNGCFIERTKTRNTLVT